MHLSITKQIALLLALALGGALMDFGIFYYFFSFTDAEAVFVEIASDQNLRAEQLRDYAEMVHSGQEEDRDKLLAAVDEFDQAMRQLEGEESTEENELLFPPQEVEDELAAAKQFWGEYRSSLLLIAARTTDAPQRDSAYALVESTIPLLTKATDNLVDEYVVVSRGAKEQVFLFLSVVAGLDALFLLLGIWVIRNHLAERRQEEEAVHVNLALQRVRNEVLSMQGVEDWHQVANCLGRELGRLIAFDGCGIAIVNRERRQFFVYDVSPAGSYKGQTCDFLPRSLEEAVETGEPVYRRNRAEMAKWGDNIGPERRSAVDVPFTGGTIGLNSAGEDAFSARDIATLQQFAQVVSEAQCRVNDLQAVERAFHREQAMGRVRDRIIVARHSEDLEEMLAKTWIEELRGLGVPIHQVTLQYPTVDEGYFASLRTVKLITLSDASVRLADFPWVREVWESGQPVVVGKEQLAGKGFDPEVQHVLEVPMPGGSLGVNTTVRGGFDEEAVHTVQLFVSLIAEGMERVRDFEALRQAEQSLKVEVALQRVRNEILLMQGQGDWERVALCFWEVMKDLVDFDECSIDFVDLQLDRYYLCQVGRGTVKQSEWIDQLPRSLRQAVTTGQPVYRRNRDEVESYGDITSSQVHSIIDVPFSGGTFAINSAREEAFSTHDIEVLERFAQVLNEGYRRLEDLKVLAQQEGQLHQAQKLEAIGQLATGVAHEINNPLTSVLGYSELLLRRPLDPEVLEHLKTIHQEGERAQEIAGRLLQFVRRQKSNLQPLSLNLLVEEVLTLVRPQFELSHVRLSAELAEGLPQLELHPGQMQQLLLALLQNSREAIRKTGKDGQIEVRTSQQGAWVRLEVADDGPGIPEAILEKIFEPFFTTKEVGTGTGMGLSLCFAIAREQGGRLWAEPSQTGACLVLELPVRAGADESLPKEEERDAG